MQKINKVLSILLAVFMIMFVVPMVASAQPASETTDTLDWRYDDALGVLTISGEGAMADYSVEYIEENSCFEGNRPWEDYVYDIQRVIIDEGVTSIGDNAFVGCDVLTDVVIPNTVETIGEYAFSYCYNLTSIEIPDSVTRIDMAAFSECSSLSEITMGKGIKGIGNFAFSECNVINTVNYNGTEEEWGQVVIGNMSNMTLLEANFTYSDSVSPDTYNDYPDSSYDSGYFSEDMFYESLALNFILAFVLAIIFLVKFIVERLKKAKK